MIGIFKYDLKEGFRQIVFKLLFFVVILVWINYITTNNISLVADELGCNKTFMDYAACMIGGPRYIPKEALNTYVLPVLWLIIYAIIAFATGMYPTQDLSGYGQHILMRSKRRINWWAGKCAWNAAVVLVMFVILYFTIFVNALIHGADVSLKATGEIVSGVAYANVESVSWQKVAFIVFVMPVVVTLVLSMLQMVVELMIAPIAGFFASQSIVFLSTMYSSPILFANYAILPHNDFSCGSNIHMMHGLIGCAIGYVVMFAIGAVYFAYRDIK